MTGSRFEASASKDNVTIARSQDARDSQRHKHLKEYRVCLLSEDDHVKALAAIYCETDDEAWLCARRGLEPAERIEIWDRERFVARGDALERHQWC